MFDGQRNPDLLCARARRDETLMPQSQAVWQANMPVHGAVKVWHQMNWEGISAANSGFSAASKSVDLDLLSKIKNLSIQ